MVSAGTVDLSSEILGSSKNQSKSSSGSRKIDPKTTRKHESSTFERSEALGDALQTLGEASKSGLGRVREGSRALSGRPGRPQEAPRASRGASGEPPLAIQTKLGRSPSAFGPPKHVRTATTSNFRRFLVRAWEGRTSIFASQRSALLAWDGERTERKHPSSPHLENH